jgi:hypothetical protein
MNCKKICITKYEETPADNERFGASGGVTPQEKQSELASEYSAGTLVSPPPSPSRRTLCVMRER